MSAELCTKHAESARVDVVTVHTTRFDWVSSIAGSQELKKKKNHLPPLRFSSKSPCAFVCVDTRLSRSEGVFQLHLLPSVQTP